MTPTAVKPLSAPARLAARKLASTLAQHALDRRPPVQAAVDVAVPLAFAWEQWMSFDAFTEGTHRIESVHRKGKRLSGRAGHEDWKAEVVDEREHEAFAWRSLAGTDCAGLVTFHRLSERLTRIELDLDVLPTGPLEAVLLATGLAERRAVAELRRFKAQVEFINPDVYETNGNRNGNHRDAADDE
jgi:uncharacterized membrane protein